MTPKFVLHIDDDDDDRQHLKEVIESSNAYQLMQQTDGRKGLNFLEQAKSLGDLPSLIILDMNMPGVDGRDVLKKIKEDEVLNKIPVIVFTTSNGVNDRIFCKKYGVPMLVKPFTMKEFDVTVQKILEYA
jgi:CheY-like chemotaxis protein